MASNAKDLRLGHGLVQLRRHLLKCYDCKGARQSGNPDGMCTTGRILTLTAADDFDVVIEMRRKAHGHADGAIYACPDLSRHSESYQLSAILFKVIPLQGELF